MKRKVIITTILIVLAIGASLSILAFDGYFNKKSIDNKILSVQDTTTKPIVLAKDTTTPKTTVTAKKAVVKKAPVKKTTKKKVVKKRKSKLNLNPPPFTPETAPFSAKNRYN
jgi:hypothetical protein